MSPKSHFIALRAKFKQPKCILLLDLYTNLLALVQFPIPPIALCKRGAAVTACHTVGLGTSAGGGSLTVLWQVQEIRWR